MGVKATQPEGRTSENDLDDGNGKGTEGEERIEEKIQDVLVPWVLRSKPKPKSKSKPKTKSHPKSESTPHSTSSPNQNGNGDDSGNTTSDPVDEEDRADQEKEEQREEGEEEEEKEEEKVFNRYYHLFIEGELRDLIHQAGKEEGYRILPPISSSPSPSSTPSSLPVSTTTKNDKKEINDGDGDGPGNGKWVRIRGEGWEADNWWVEAEVGVGDGQ
jgi:tRNA (uracil-5-)-methyltransferase TRM9